MTIICWFYTWKFTRKDPFRVNFFFFHWIVKKDINRCSSKSDALLWQILLLKLILMLKNIERNHWIRYCVWGVWWELFSDLTDLTDWHCLISNFKEVGWAFKTSIVINFILLKVNKVKKSEQIHLRSHGLEASCPGPFIFLTLSCVSVPCPDESLSTRLDVSLPALCGCHGEARPPAIKSHLPSAWPPTAQPPSQQPWLIAPREWQSEWREDKIKREEGEKRSGRQSGCERGGERRKRGRRRRIEKETGPDVPLFALGY